MELRKLNFCLHAELDSSMLILSNTDVDSCKIQPIKAYTKVPDPMNVVIVLWPGYAQKLQSLAFGVWTRPPFLGCIKAENCPLPSYRTHGHHGYEIITGSMKVISIYCLLHLMVATSHHILYEFAKTKDILFQYSWLVGIVSLSETIHLRVLDTLNELQYDPRRFLKASAHLLSWFADC